MNKDYQEHQITPEDMSIVQKVIALHARMSKDNDLENPMLGLRTDDGKPDADLSLENRITIGDACRDFLHKCRDIAMTERLEYWTTAEIENEKFNNKEAMRDANNNKQRDMLAQLQDRNQQLADTHDGDVKYDRSERLQNMSRNALRDFAQTLITTHALDGMAIAVEGDEKGPAGKVRDQWAFDNQLSEDEFYKGASLGPNKLFGQDFSKDPYNMAIGVAKAMAETDIPGLSATLNAMQPRSRAAELLFKREADAQFDEAAKELQAEAQGMPSL